jgi:hypothetical protein
VVYLVPVDMAEVPTEAANGVAVVVPADIQVAREVIAGAVAEPQTVPVDRVVQAISRLQVLSYSQRPEEALEATLQPDLTDISP